MPLLHVPLLQNEHGAAHVVTLPLFTFPSRTGAAVFVEGGIEGGVKDGTQGGAEGGTQGDPQDIPQYTTAPSMPTSGVLSGNL